MLFTCAKKKVLPGVCLVLKKTISLKANISLCFELWEL